MNLDEQKVYERLDEQGMAAYIAGLPRQCRRAWDEALAFPLPNSYKKALTVAVLGIGGSAIGGDMAADLQALEGGSSVVVVRGYHYVQAHADKSTLVIASSYSGNTEETLATFREALKQGCPAIAVTRGGKVGELARQHKVPVFPIGMECQPRAAIGYSLFPLLAFLQRLGLGVDRSKEVAEAIGEMERMTSLFAPATPTSQNPAKQLASAIGERVAVIYGAEHLAAVARRWKTQINENAKSWAFAESLPEQNHNSIEGLSYPAPWERIFVVLLRGSGYNPRVALRTGLTQQALSRARVPHQVLDARGDGRLAQAMTMVLLGDWVSYYLAIGRGVNPTPVPTLEWLKAQMEKT